MLRPPALPLDRHSSGRAPNHDYESLSTPPRSPRSQLLHQAGAAGLGPRRRRVIIGIVLLWLLAAGLSRTLLARDPYGSLDTPPGRLESLARRWLLGGPAYAFFSDTRARDRGGRAFAMSHDAHDGVDDGLNFDRGLFEGLEDEAEGEVKEVGIEQAAQLLLEDAIAVADYGAGNEQPPLLDEQLTPRINYKINVNPHSRAVPTSEWDTRLYLSYEPHSGFHNQRVALANAITLSRLLNRTLLVPPAILGRAIPWTPDLTSRTIAAERAKANLIPTNLGNGASRIDRQALNEVKLWTAVGWDYLISPAIFVNASVVDRWNSSSDWFAAGQDEGGLGIGPEETVVFEDTERRTWRLFDNKASVTRLDGFANRLDIDDLKEGDLGRKRLIRFGSMFGSRKLSLSRSANKAMHNYIISSMIIADDSIDHAADEIAALLGPYTAVHLRVGDNFYRASAQKSILSVLRRVVLETFQLDPTHYTSLLAEVTARHAGPGPDTHPHAGAFAFKPDLASGLTCRGDPYPPGHPAEALNQPIYVATDSADPVNDPDLALFLCMLPCAFVLSDFVEHVPTLGAMVRGEDGRGKSEFDGTEVGSFLWGFLEAAVAGRANEFVGNIKSTFSGYVEQVLQPHYRQVRETAARSRASSDGPPFSAGVGRRSCAIEDCV